MMAAVGAVAQHYIKFPGFEKVPAGLAAVTTPPGTYGLAALFLLSGVMELAVWTQDPKKEVGDFGDPVGLGMYDLDMRNRELNNGRMAMFAALGIISADLLTGKDGMQQLGLGAMAPMGFFDPLGFSKVGDKEGFRNLRTAELKHGRVAMMAAVGAVAQHYIKFPGFEKVPAGLAAVTTPPGTYGLAALFLFSGVMELAVWTQDPKKEVGDFGDPVGLGMYAALGIISADLLTGKDGIQQLGF